MKKIRQKEGFTFIEVMVALAVLALILTAVFRLYTQSVSMLLMSGFELKAPLLAKKIISEKKSSKDEIVQDFGNFKDEFENYSWKIDIFDVLTSFSDENFSEEIKSINLKKVTITITNKDEREYKTFFYVKSKG